jgi:hypothetical protein
MSIRDDITGAVQKGINDSVERMLSGEHYTTCSQAQPPALTYETLKQTFDYCKPEKLTVNGETHEIYGYKVHESESIPEGIIVMTQKMRPGSTELGRLVILFVNEGKAVIYDPAKMRPEPPPFETPRVEYNFGFGIQSAMMPVSPYLPLARKVIQEKWPDLICGPDDFFEVYDLISAE